VGTDSVEADDPSVRHLAELGYIDPQPAAAAQAKRRRRLEDDLRRAVELLNKSQREEGVELLRRLASDDPEWSAPRQLLCDAEFRSGNHSAVQVHLDWLSEHNVTTPRLSMIAGTLALQKGDLRTALVELEYAAHVDRTLAGVATLLGTVQLRLRNWDEAEEAFRRAVRQNRSDARAFDGLATISLYRREFDHAARWAMDALAQDMQMPLAHYHLGVALAQMRHPAAADALLACARLDSTRAAPLYWLARVSRDAGDAAKAAEYRQRARHIILRRRGKI
jgi:tetratricopeptide (TPR) repeat protein